MSNVTVTTDETAVSVSPSTANVNTGDDTATVVVTDGVSTSVELVDTIVTIVPESVSVTVEPTVLSVVVQPTGAPGPAGSWEDETMYAERIDWVGTTVCYKGQATPNSAEAAAVWRIQKIVFTGDDVAKTWADGSDDFNQVWNDRLTLDYS